jgi:hypothetical protein
MLAKRDYSGDKFGYVMRLLRTRLRVMEGFEPSNQEGKKLKLWGQVAYEL